MCGVFHHIESVRVLAFQYSTLLFSMCAQIVWMLCLYCPFIIYSPRPMWSVHLCVCFSVLCVYCLECTVAKVYCG